MPVVPRDTVASTKRNEALAGKRADVVCSLNLCSSSTAFDVYCGEAIVEQFDCPIGVLCSPHFGCVQLRSPSGSCGARYTDPNDLAGSESKGCWREIEEQC